MRFQDINDYVLDDIFDIVEKKEREIKQEFYRKNTFKRCMKEVCKKQRFGYYGERYFHAHHLNYFELNKLREDRYISATQDLVLEQLFKTSYIKSIKKRYENMQLNK